MTSVQLEKKILEYTKGLPKETLQGIIDFIEFFRKKKTISTSHNISEELSSLNYSQTRHLEQEFNDYKQIYPQFGNLDYS